MKEKKLNKVILLLFSMLFIINLIRINQDYDFINSYLENNEKINTFHISGFWNLTSIYIDGLASGPGAHNWTWVLSQEWFGGGIGSWSNPYRIENITTTSINIRYSDKYFILRNCTVFNSINAAISFLNVSNGKIIENVCGFNEIGITLHECSNNTISDNNIISSKTFGLHIFNSFNNTIFNNRLNKCGISISYSSIQNESNIIDTSNLINGKPFYFYSNEKNLGHDNFTNAGQVILHNCNESLISDLNLNQCSIGISLINCYYNWIENNTFTNNSMIGIIPSMGIEITSSSNNIIKNNIFNKNIIGVGIGLTAYGIEASSNQIYGNNISNGLCGVLIYGGEKNNICIFEDNSCIGNNFEDNNCFDASNGQWIYFLIIGCVLSITGLALLLFVIYPRKKSK